MAKTLVVFATYYLSLSFAEDKFTRSGDLDRGPPKSAEFQPNSHNFDSSDSGASVALKRRLELSTEFFLVPRIKNLSTSNSVIDNNNCINCPNANVETMHLGNSGFFRNEIWVVPILSLSIVTLILIIGFEVFVLCKAYRTTPSRRHLFLGQMLLLGLFFGAILPVIFTLNPTHLTCAVVRFGTGVSYAIIFASLLVKCVFLVSLNGGVYLPAPYQGLLLLFAILIQVAINVQWLLTNPPIVDQVTFAENFMINNHKLLLTLEDLSGSAASNMFVVQLCRTPFTDMLFSLIYVIFLIIFVTILAVKSRGIRDNYREASYIGMSVGCTISIWIIWTMVGFMVHERHKDACIAFGLVVSSVLVFLIMFMPKGRQLAAMGKEGVYVEDREERFSSLSRAGSGYSPSFFHFKPVKYGLGHGSSTHKVPPGFTTLGPDLALYPAPPSYNRLYYPSPPGYSHTRYFTSGIFLSPDDGNVYTTLEPTLSSNPNVYFQRGTGVHPGMMY